MAAHSMTWDLPAAAAGVSEARRNVVHELRSCGGDEPSIAAAALMTTELATNAVLHAGTPFTVTIDIEPFVVRVSVRDASVIPPVVGPMPGPDAPGGRGLALIAELARRWGCDAIPGGKSVWFEAETRAG